MCVKYCKTKNTHAKTTALNIRFIPLFNSPTETFLNAKYVKA